MKIIAGNSFGSNIEMICDKCNCIFCVESKEDWSIRMVSPNFYSMNYKVPEYSIECPNCGYIKFLGFDPVDLIGTESESLSCFWIPLFSRRSDWKDRYKVETINC
jgi:hypothetical protein